MFALQQVSVINDLKGGIINYLSRRAKRSFSTFKVRRGSYEKIHLVQGKEQWLCFAGTVVKRYPHVQGKRNPSKTVGVVRGIRGQTHKP